jgi:hypothetical protein
VSDHLKVVPFSGGSVADIPAGLRNLAELFEVGSAESSPGMNGSRAFAWVNVDEHGVIASGALGQGVDRFQAAGILSAGISDLVKP